MKGVAWILAGFYAQALKNATSTESSDNGFEMAQLLQQRWLIVVCLVILIGIVLGDDACPCGRTGYVRPNDGHFIPCNDCCAVTAPGQPSTLVQQTEGALQMEHVTRLTAAKAFVVMGFSRITTS